MCDKHFSLRWAGGGKYHTLSLPAARETLVSSLNSVCRQTPSGHVQVKALSQKVGDLMGHTGHVLAKAQCTLLLVSVSPFLSLCCVFVFPVPL